MKTGILAATLCLCAAPAFALSFSSIALSPNTGAWGQAHDFPTRGAADATALGYCQEHSSQPDDCRIVTWSQGEYCAAVAVHHKGDGSVVWGSDSGPNRDVARAKAYSNCVNERGARCDEILVDVCSH
jgi:hypothetical protein